jgi:O-antigen/teichoic acid export membrane protein
MALSFQDWLKLVFYTDFKQTLVTKISFFFSAGRLLCYGLLFFLPSLSTYAWILIVTSVLFSVVWWAIFRRRFDYHVVWGPRSLSILRSSLHSYGLWDHLNRTVIDTVFTIDTVVLSWFVAVGPISDYTIALRFTSLFFMIPMQLHLGLQVALSNYVDRSNQVAATNAFLKLGALISVLQLTFMLLFGEWLIHLLFGGDTSPAVTRYATIIAIGVTVMNVSLPLLSVINNFGSLRRVFTRVFLPLLVLGLGSYIAAARTYGAEGVAWANVVVYAVFAAALALFVARHHPFPVEWSPLTARERGLMRQILRGKTSA